MFNEKDKSLNKKNIPAYLDTSLTFEERAADLVSRMTLEEKAAQLKNVTAAIPGLGVSGYNYWKEALHGVARQGKATSFPTSLSMANTWDCDLVFKAAEITATEARGKNSRINLSYWSPTINMARDPRWGRNEETYGEDPYLTGRLGIEFVKGMQGNDPDYIKTIATVKHFVANNVEKERRGGSSVMNESTLRDYYGRVFQNVVENSDPASAMGSYNATTIYRNGKLLYDYIPSNANSYIMQDLLRRNWGFTGYVTGDCGAFDDFNKIDAYKQALFPGENINEIPQSATITKGFLNGADTDCGSAANASSVLEAVELGYITENELSMNVYNLFLQRMRTGEFDRDARYSDITSEVLETVEHIAVAEKAAEDSWVLLKNEGILPLRKDIKKVVLVGALADEVVLGDYSGSPENQITPYEGIVSALKITNPDAQLIYPGSVTDDTELMSIKNLVLVKNSGETKAVDLSNAININGMTAKDGVFVHITRKASALIPSVNFEDVASIRVEMATGSNIGGKLKLYYGEGGPQVAEALSVKTDSIDIFTECTGEYTGASGGYNRTADLYIGFEANQDEFSIKKYKTELDSADVIIAYAGTTLSDSAEFRDRDNIDLPQSQAHVIALTKAYPGKTVVAMQTVGQIDVTPFEREAKAIMWTSYNGQTQGLALGKILTGLVNPSGKLTTTWYTAEDLERMPITTEEVKDENGIIRYHNNYEIKSGKAYPGRTYQYYNNTPVYPFGYGLSYTSFEYSNISVSASEVDANGAVTVSVDVTNTGSASGKEIVQFYVIPPGADGVNTPKKQLKGFDKVELMPGETKRVSVRIDVPELRFFDEAEQRMYVKQGSYTVYAGKNSEDDALRTDFTVSGILKSVLKTVAVIPNGITVHGLIDTKGENLKAADSINANLSAVMTDDWVYDLSEAEVVYSSDNESIAVVDELGTVRSGGSNGVTRIKASVTIDGITKSVAFPVVSSVDIKAGEDDKSEAVQTLRNEIDSYIREAYSDKNWMKLEEIANSVNFDEIVRFSELKTAVEKALSDMRAVNMDKIERRYVIKSENPQHIQNGIIDYRKGGIEPYSANRTKITGTVTVDTPYSGIKLNVYDGDRKIDSTNFKWQLEKLGGTKRNIAAIDSNTGELTVMANGLIRVCAVDIEKLVCGEAVIYVNLQVEGEYADNGGGANTEDYKDGASVKGFGANNIGSTSSYWIEFRGIKLTNLKKIILRYSLKTGNVAANFSLNKTSLPDSLIANGILTRTGSWMSWNEAAFDVDYKTLGKAVTDDNGLATIYIQTNSANIDYFKLIYHDTNDEIPYLITAIHNSDNGKINVSVNYVGSGNAGQALLIAENKSLSICGGGTYELPLKAEPGQNISLYISDNNGQKLSETFEHIYQTPEQGGFVIYNASDDAYSVMFTEIKECKIPEINGLTGYGPLVKKPAGFKYTFKDKEYWFESGWRMSDGSEREGCLFFTPKAPCIVTVVFTSGDGRDLYVVQNGIILASGKTAADKLTAISCRVTDVTVPVYVYGGEDNKIVCAVIVEYLNAVSDSEDVTVQSVEWGSELARLSRNNRTGETKISSSSTGRIWTDVDLSVFAVSDLDNIPDSFNINYIYSYRDRLYAACDNGILLTVTACPKCYKLRKPTDFDIKSIELKDGAMCLKGECRSAEISLSELGADEIEYEEARVLISGGAVLVDVRNETEYNEHTIEGAINIPLENIDYIKTYKRDTTFIFFCSKGIKSEEAVSRAKKLGFENVYALSSENLF